MVVGKTRLFEPGFDHTVFDDGGITPRPQTEAQIVFAHQHADAAGEFARIGFPQPRYHGQRVPDYCHHCPPAMQVQFGQIFPGGGQWPRKPQHQCLVEQFAARIMQVRLVKGAYWDSEIKHAQERGLTDFPLFTRKPATDVSYLACAKDMFEAAKIRPAFATHNALTVATILQWAGDNRDFEFQRLHGMGEGLFERLVREEGYQCRTYAPVGGHRDLLAYLVRRLLENGANSSFVHQLADESVGMQELLISPLRLEPHSSLPLPPDLFGTGLGGVVGARKFFYDVWGDAVNVAARMETTDQEGRIQVPENVFERLREEFVLEERGEIDIKGKGMMRTWYLVGRKSNPAPPESIPASGMSESRSG